MRNGSAYRHGHILILKSIKVHKSMPRLQPIHIREQAHIVSAIVKADARVLDTWNRSSIIWLTACWLIVIRK